MFSRQHYLIQAGSFCNASLFPQFGKPWPREGRGTPLQLRPPMRLLQKVMAGQSRLLSHAFTHAFTRTATPMERVQAAGVREACEKRKGEKVSHHGRHAPWPTTARGLEVHMVAPRNWPLVEWQDGWVEDEESCCWNGDGGAGYALVNVCHACSVRRLSPTPFPSHTAASALVVASDAGQPIRKLCMVAAAGAACCRCRSLLVRAGPVGPALTSSPVRSSY
eukprot:359879-Chlamydomonas_euryale.AAC.3